MALVEITSGTTLKLPCAIWKLIYVRGIIGQSRWDTWTLLIQMLLYQITPIAEAREMTTSIFWARALALVHWSQLSSHDMRMSHVSHLSLLRTPSQSFKRYVAVSIPRPATIRRLMPYTASWWRSIRGSDQDLWHPNNRDMFLPGIATPLRVVGGRLVAELRSQSRPGRLWVGVRIIDQRD